MLETKVMHSNLHLEDTLDKMLFTVKLIELGDEPQVTEDELRSSEKAMSQ